MEDRINQSVSGTERKRLVLMRGLTGSGKSWTAKRVAERDQGVLLELDSFFEVDTTGRGEVKRVWDRKALPAARRWHMGRVCKAIDSGLSPIVVDEDHRPGMSAKAIAAYAMLHSDSVEFCEPESTWWKAIRPHLGQEDSGEGNLARWAQKLCRLSRKKHVVQPMTLAAHMERWSPELSPLDLVAWGESPTEGGASRTEEVPA